MRIAESQTCMCPHPIKKTTYFGFDVCLCGDFIVPGALERERERVASVRAVLLEKRAERVRAEESARAKAARELFEAETIDMDAFARVWDGRRLA